MPTAAELSTYYARYSYDTPEAWEVPAATREALMRLARSFEPYRQTGRLLDVGCGAGSVLRAMEEMGWAAEGTEISGAAIERLQAEGHTVHMGRLPELDLIPAAYDVVVLSELLEHLPDPLAHLGPLRRCVRPGGAVYATTPNFGSLSRRLLGARWRAVSLPEHVLYFESPTLGSLLRRAGFEIREIQAENFDPAPFLWRMRTQPVDTPGSPSPQPVEVFRAAMVEHPVLAHLKNVINLGLRAFRLGDTLKAIAINPGP